MAEDVFVDGNLWYPLLVSYIAEAMSVSNYFFFIARSLSCLDSNVTV